MVSKNIHRNKLIAKIFISGIIAAVIILFSYFRVFEVYELTTLDLRFKLRPSQKVSDKIVIIELAQDTLEQIGSWPIDRQFYATLISVLKAYGAQGVIFDFIFTQQQKTDSDQALVDSAKSAENVYIAKALRLSSKKGQFPTAETSESDPFLALEQAVKGVGHINIINDIDGKRRRLPVFIKYQDSLFPQISLLAVCDYLGIDWKNLDVEPGEFVKLTEKIRIPIDENGMSVVNFAGKWGEVFRHYSFIDILKSYVQIQKGQKPRIDLNRLSGSLCVVGFTAAGTHDLNPIPLQIDYPMVGIHANFMNMILENIFIKRLSKLNNILIVILLGLITLCAVLRLRPSYALGVVICIVISFTITALAVFAFLHVWMDLFYPIVMIAMIYLGATFYKYISERNKRMLIEKELDIARAIQKSFLKDVPPEKSNLDIAAEMDTAKAVGGDLYDFVDMGEDKIGVMIGDVSGKGVPAALFMAKLVSDFRFHSRIQQDPARMITDLNNQVSSESTSGLFVSISHAVIDVKNKTLDVVDAGHLPLFLAHKDGSVELIKAEGGIAVGIMEGMDFGQTHVDLKQGDVLVFYTDGVTEARNFDKEEFGEDRIIKILEKSYQKSAKEIVNDIFKSVRRFQGKAPQHDDITVIVVKILNNED